MTPLAPVLVGESGAIAPGFPHQNGRKAYGSSS